MRFVPMLLLFITITACSVWVAVEGKIKDSIFLSKCTCTKEGGKPDCDFSKLSKKKLLLLVEKLSSTQIICVSADKFLLPTFSSSLVTLLPGSGSFVTEPSSSPTSGEAMTKKTTKNDPNIFPDGSMAAVPRLPPGISACAYDGYMATVRGVQFAFPTTVITTNIVRDAASRAHNEAIRDLMLELEEEDDGCKFNLHGGYRSKDGFLDRKEPALQWLKTQIHSHVRQLLSLTNSTDLTYDIAGWGAVLRAGHGQSTHVHPGAIYAGVYYVSAPREIVASGLSHGCLRFLDPRQGADMAQVVRGRNVYGAAFEVCPEAQGGLLVLFPSWLMHEVKPMLDSYKGPRIAVSFNIVYRP